MSELINNREYRQKVLKKLILELHDGKSVEEVKERFAKLIEGVTTEEIAQMEQNLIAEGMPVEEVQRLCDVHSAVFKGSIEEIHSPQKSESESPGHPVHTFKLENRAIEDHIEKRIQPLLESMKNDPTAKVKEQLLEAVIALREIDNHYSRKENLLFPYLEKAGITAPPKVMWGVDDEIREELKELEGDLKIASLPENFIQKFEEALARVKEMIFKEENILLPMAIENLTQDEWLTIAQESEEIGYCFITPKEKWIPKSAMGKEEIIEQQKEGALRFETGILKPIEIESMLNHLPVDITFVDKDDVVKYFSHGKDRIFARTKTVIGRKVAHCHPPASVHVVEKIVEDFKSGKKDNEDFWIKMGDRYVYIRYFAVRDQKGDYLGTLEVTQDIAPLQAISGEKRLLSDEPENN